MKFSSKDMATGLIFVGTGGFYLIYGLQTLQLGTALNMGPGYFPFLLSSATISIGVITVARSFFVADAVPFGKMNWRSVAMITLAILFFAVFALRLGLFITVFCSAFIASHAQTGLGLKKAALASLCIAVLSLLVFRVVVPVPIPTLGRWLH